MKKKKVMTQIYRLSDIMNIQMTRKNKNIKENDRGNPLMIGVNIYSIDKYIQMLLNANYTIVIIARHQKLHLLEKLQIFIVTVQILSIILKVIQII